MWVAMVAASYATADRSRRNVVRTIATKIQDDWDPPKLCSLPWDGKMTSTLTINCLRIERLAVIVGDGKVLKLLVVPSYTKGVV
jgi:hypothetical protein